MPSLPLALLALWCAAGAPRPATSPDQQARALVTEFVVSDLEGRAERYQNAELTPERLMASQPPEGSEELPDTGLLFDTVWEPFVAVTSFRVVDVQVKGAGGLATVDYARVAESERLEVRESAGVERVVLRLRHDGRRWWVVDPPPAHVEVGALVRMFEAELRPYDAAWEAQAAPEQRASRDRLAAGLRVLRQAADRAKAPAGPAAR